ncbi:MAG TPA: histidinol-phosphate transaminase [Polyangiaceae bacterium]|nr:histidinol-phosphate transaminase [Polyangiaceae bacterium]
MAGSLVRHTVRFLDGYVPGEQPPPGAGVVKLNTNECPYPPSPRVLDALRAIGPDALRRYPPPMADDFRAAASLALGVPADAILAGNGSDDILTIATRTFLAPADALAFPTPTYSLYQVLARLQDARIIAVPWADNWSLPVDGLLASGARAIYLANPNAPSGTTVPVAAVEELALRFDGALLVDEAYADFADANCLELPFRRPNVIVVRTMSKSYALAGIRFGFAVANPDVIRQMAKVKDSYNCDAVAIAAATAALADQEYARSIWERIRAERERLTCLLDERGWHVLPSQANFVLATVPGGDASRALLALKKRGILVRHFDAPGLQDKLRITVGSPEQTDALVAAIDAGP